MPRTGPRGLPRPGPRPMPRPGPGPMPRPGPGLPAGPVAHWPKSRSAKSFDLGQWATGPLGQWGTGPLGQWGTGPLGQRGIGPRSIGPYLQMLIFPRCFQGMGQGKACCQFIFKEGGPKACIVCKDNGGMLQPMSWYKVGCLWAHTTICHHMSHMLTYVANTMP
jgi:hypothetical protein